MDIEACVADAAYIAVPWGICIAITWPSIGLVWPTGVILLILTDKYAYCNIYYKCSQGIYNIAHRAVPTVILTKDFIVVYASKLINKIFLPNF